jgi:ABC-2 type transport system ATP-binding protein
MRVEEYLRYAAWVKGVPTSSRATAVDEALARTGLSRRRRDRIRHLSGGMVRRLGIAQATINQPRLLVLDEPTAGLDPEQRSNLYALVRECVDDDTVVLVSTHLLEDVVELGGKVTVLDEGAVLFEGTLEQLVSWADAAEVTTQRLRAAFLDLLPPAQGA